MQALIAAAGPRRSGGMWTYIVVVDEDIDPSDINQVLWALCTRVDPAKSVQILRARATDIDARLSPKKRAEKDYSMGLMLINACKPFAWKDAFSPTSALTQEEAREIEDKWQASLRFTGKN